LHPAVGLLVCLRKRECSESCAEPSSVLARSSYTALYLHTCIVLVMYFALYMSECQVQNPHQSKAPIQILKILSTTRLVSRRMLLVCRRRTCVECSAGVPQAPRRGQDTPGPAAVRGEEWERSVQVRTRETHGGGRRYEAHAHEIPRARIYVDHETRVPACSSSRTRDECACMFVSTRTRHVCLRISRHAHVSCGCYPVRCVRAV
jgi:hypothetical protein